MRRDKDSGWDAWLAFFYCTTSRDRLIKQSSNLLIFRDQCLMLFDHIFSSRINSLTLSKLKQGSLNSKGSWDLSNIIFPQYQALSLICHGLDRCSIMHINIHYPWIDSEVLLKAFDCFRKLAFWKYTFRVILACQKIAIIFSREFLLFNSFICIAFFHSIQGPAETDSVTS